MRGMLHAIYSSEIGISSELGIGLTAEGHYSICIPWLYILYIYIYINI